MTIITDLELEIKIIKETLIPEFLVLPYDEDSEARAEVLTEMLRDKMMELTKLKSLIKGA